MHAEQMILVRVRSLKSYPVLMTCGHVVNRLMNHYDGTPAGAPCEVCRGDMTPEQFAQHQKSVANYR
jgi:hypothetical protein